MSRRDILALLPTAQRTTLPEELPEFPAVDDPVACFRDRLESVGGFCFEAGSAEEVAKHLTRLLQEGGGERILWESPGLVARLGFDPAEEAAGWWMSEHPGGIVAAPLVGGAVEPSALLAADVSLSIAWADWGIADTGSVVQSSGPARGRALAVLAPAHVAVLARDRLLANEADFYSRPAADASAVTVVTGPSRTADIEKKLILGVHGPKTFGVVLVGGRRSAPGERDS